MPKRSVLPDSDREDTPDATPPSKRARQGGESEDDELLPRQRDPKGKGKARRTDDDEEDEEQMEPEELTEQAEEEFENLNRERIQASIEYKRKVRGGIAEHGIIESIEMHQFMCHKYLTFQFGPQINFIIGHNGSGKSAVLSAITVALGGKATSTGRGTGLKSFIREGQSVSEVSITLKNQGDEAYRPTEYGKSITITRRFTKEGSSSWKIKGKDGRVVSTKKDELSAICDHMNIQVDNPMNVLTQDAARQFLSASHPADKYKFFLRGTQLSQLSEEYDSCLENITQTTKVLAQKKEALPDLRTAFKEATVRFKEANKAREQKKKADELKKELAWAHVKSKEDDLALKLAEVAKLSKRLPRIQESVDTATAEFNAATARVAELEAEHNNLGNIAHLSEKKTALQGDIRANKTKLNQFNTDMKSMETSIKATNKQIEGYEKQIAEEARRMAAHTQAKHEETQRKLEEARDAVAAAETMLQDLQNRKREATERCDNAKNEGTGIQTEVENFKKRIQECEEMIKRCNENEKNSLAPYGNDIRTVLEKIKNMRWLGDPPLGPLGVHVKAKDPQKWGDILRTQLRGYLTAFALTDARDRGQLKQLLDQSGNQNIQIIIFEKDLFDYSQGEPGPQYLTVLRALNVSDPYVLRILINQAGIERQLLSDTRRQGEDMLKQIRGGNVWSKDGFSVRVYPEGGAYSVPLGQRHAKDATSLLLTGRDAKSEILHWQEEIKKVNVDYQQAMDRLNARKQDYAQGKRTLAEIAQEEAKANDTHRRAKVHLSNLQQEANDDLPAGIAGFEAAKAEAEQEKQNLLEQFKEAARAKAAVDDEQKRMMHEMAAIKVQVDEFDQKRVESRGKVEDAAAVRLQTQGHKNHYEGKLAEEQAKINQVEEVAKVLQQEYENWTAGAEEYCERVANPRDAKTVQRDLDSVQAALKEREKRHGATVEEMTIEVNKAKAKLETAERDLKQMATLNKALKASLIKRLSRWQEFRRHIALRCKYEFQYHLSHRGYFGKVLFDHKNGTLQLKVQTDDQIATQQGGRDKDPRSLSGGEKSFSTICLLLSLWESIGCPLRCLDEFDVFMDAVNRRISMKMMIDTANSSDKKQYILITPQDMTNIHVGNSVRVHRMTDPERGQGVLNFGS